MKMEPYQLEKYNAVMAERIVEISKNDHIIHGYMVYQCEECHNIYVMWLEKGLEDPTDDQKTGNHKPVPFGIVCPACGGVATHTLWSFGKDSLGKNYKSYQKYVEQPNRFVYRNFFWNDPVSDCGVPIIFEPDYYWERIRGSRYYLTEIYINTLPDDEYEEFNNTINALASIPNKNIIEIPPTMSLDPTEAFLEGKINREQRRHGAYGNNGYKRPRSNKKLYEY